jgi:hypothetical protein
LPPQAVSDAVRKAAISAEATRERVKSVSIHRSREPGKYRVQRPPRVWSTSCPASRGGRQR